MTNKQLRYIGASDGQVHFRNFDDPRGLLVEGQTYAVLREEIHSWHTNIILVDFPDKRFNSVSFEEVAVTDKPEIRRYGVHAVCYQCGTPGHPEAAQWTLSPMEFGPVCQHFEVEAYVAAKVKEAVERVRREEVGPLIAALEDAYGWFDLDADYSTLAAEVKKYKAIISAVRKSQEVKP